MRWEWDVGPLSDKDWNRAVFSPRSVSSNYNESLTQLSTVHRANYSTTRLSRFRPGHVDECPKCHLLPGSFFHLQWSWPKVNGVWEKVIKNDEVGSPVPLCPNDYIHLPDPTFFDTRYSYMFLVESLYYAKKVIARTWLPTELPQWLNTINNALLLKKWTFQQRKCPHKFSKIWDRWLQSEMMVHLPHDSLFDNPPSPWMSLCSIHV